MFTARRRLSGLHARWAAAPDGTRRRSWAVFGSRIFQEADKDEVANQRLSLLQAAKLIAPSLSSLVITLPFAESRSSRGRPKSPVSIRVPSVFHTSVGV